MRKPEKQCGISTFQGTDASIEGTIEFEGTIRMDGNFKGKISSPAGVVIIGERAVVDARIDVGSAVVMGNVVGFINAKNKIELFPPAKVSGDIQAPVVAVEAGVFFQGNCMMRNRVETDDDAE